MVRSARRSSTARSTSISPAVRIPARSTTSATSACSAPRCRCPRTATRSRAITSVVGGGFGPDAACGREIYRDVKAEDAPKTVERMLKAYLAHRASADESFLAFTRRHDDRRAQDACSNARRSNDADHRAADPDLDPGFARRSRPSSAPGSTAFSPASSRSTAASMPLSPEETAALLGDVTRRAPRRAGRSTTATTARRRGTTPSMPLPDRMELADGRPLRRRMMAAMGQQDCGQCGYTCEDYANAIVLKKEERLNLCIPGGKDTTRMLKIALCGIRRHSGGGQSAGTRGSSGSDAEAAAPAAIAEPTRDSPAEIAFVSAHASSTNQAPTRKPGISISTSPARGIDYAVGDSLGIFPQNDPALVDAVIAALARAAGFPHRRPHAARGSDRRRLARHRARHAVPAHLLHHRRRAAAEGEGARPRAAIRTATPRRSTCWRRWKNFPASGPIPKPLSKRSIRCSRGFIRSPRRPRSRPIA